MKTGATGKILSSRAVGLVENLSAHLRRRVNPGFGCVGERYSWGIQWGSSRFQDMEVLGMRPSLKLFTPGEALDAPAPPNRVTISLQELVSIVTDAAQGRRAWLRDFARDEVQISSDLYDVLSTYWNMRRGA